MKDIRQENQENNDLDDKYLDSWNGYSFSFMDLLNTTSVYDFIAGNLITDEQCGETLQRKQHKSSDIRPHVAIVDLNNTKDDPYVNKPKRAIEIGIEFDF